MIPPIPGPSATQALPTLADATRAIEGCADLEPRARRDQLSAVATTARILGLPPAAIPCDPGWLNARLFAREPAAYGITPGRFRNVVSGLRAALRRIGRHAPELHGAASLDPGWAALLAAVPHKGLRAGVIGLARYCSARGIVPGDVNDDVVGEYEAWDVANRLSRSAASIATTTTTAWNRLARLGPSGGPIRRLAAPARRDCYSARPEALPESFRADVARFRERLAPAVGTAFRRGKAPGPRGRCRPRTVATRVFNLHQAAGILIRGGLDPAELTSLRDLVQPVERVAEVLDFLCGRTRRALDDGEAVGGQVAQVAETLRQVAEHHVGLGGEDLERIRGWARETRPSRAERGMSALSRERLRAMIQDRPRALLVNLPEELMRRARAARAEDPTGAARLALSAVALEILLVCPLRAENLRGLRLDRHLQRLGHRGRLVTHVVLQPAETKTREPLEWPLPRPSAELLEEFVRSFRPVIAAPDNPHLLPGAGPGARSGTALAAAVTGTIERLIGIRVHLHLLRHFAAWLHLRAHPGAYEDVRRVLGHRDIQTTIRFYVAFEATAAAERFDAAVLRERHATRAVAAKAWSGRVPRRGARL